MTKEGPMSRTAKSKPAQPNATAEIKKLVVKLLSVDPKLLRNSVLTLKRVCLPEVLRRLAKSLVDRALMEDSGPASDVVGFLGAAAYPSILPKFCDCNGAEHGSRIAGLLGRIGAELSESEYIELGMHFPRLCMTLKGEPLVQAISAHRAMRASFEEQQRKRKQPV